VLAARLEAYAGLLNKQVQIISISATRNQNLDELLDLLISLAPIRPPEYDEEQITDSYERDIAADLIREACLLQLREEVPHGVGVRIDEFTERETAPGI
jgi:GTP-binding protein Era